MFKLEELQSIEWPVTISIPRKGGNIVKATMTGEYEIIDEDEYNQLIKEGGDKALLERVLVGWGKNYCDSNGDPIEFSIEARETLITIPYCKVALVNSYLECAYGSKSSKSAKAKN